MNVHAKLPYIRQPPWCVGERQGDATPCMFIPLLTLPIPAVNRPHIPTHMYIHAYTDKLIHRRNRVNNQIRIQMTLFSEVFKMDDDRET
ncbi:Flagellar motor switch protein FliG [Dirofilaria immitis]